MDTYADDAPRELVHNLEYPMGLQKSGFTPQESRAPGTALLPLVSSARSPNRACTFRYALGSPGTTVKLSSAPLIKLALNAE